MMKQVLIVAALAASATAFAPVSRCVKTFAQDSSLWFVRM